MTIGEACTQVKGFCIKKETITSPEGKKTTHKHLDTNHDYYYQVQCQLYCDEKQWCDFVVKTRNDLYVESIEMKLGGRTSCKNWRIFTSVLCSQRLPVHAYTVVASENPQTKLLCILLCVQNVCILSFTLYLLSNASPAPRDTVRWP